jgi:hypothetical protein
MENNPENRMTVLYPSDWEMPTKSHLAKKSPESSTPLPAPKKAAAKAQQLNNDFVSYLQGVYR